MPCCARRGILAGSPNTPPRSTYRARPLCVLGAGAPRGDSDGEQIAGRHLGALQARAPGAVVLPVLTQADRLVDDAEALRRAEAEFDAAVEAYNGFEDEKEAKGTLVRSARRKLNEVGNALPGAARTGGAAL